MEALPFIDDHTRPIHAAPDEVWAALLATLRAQLAVHLPGPVVAAWGLAQRARTGDWEGDVAPGDTVVGFAVADSARPHHLTLRGAHRFSRYELRFELVPRGDRVELHARTAAVFPGVHGRVYRALVIGTGGHRVAVRRMLRAVARRAERAARVAPVPA